MSNNYCIIMAGGVGSRFWPVSRIDRPKQFLDILGTGRSFLQQTYDRFVNIMPSENIIIVTSQAYVDLVREQLPKIPLENILSEPYRRNTAPCIAYATYKMLKKDPKANFVVAPSDHLIMNDSLFLNIISAGLKYVAGSNDLLTLGITPTRPDTAYGYIQLSPEKNKDAEGYTSYAVKTFTEKPDAELAKVFMDSGEFLWNSGIFIWNIQTIKRELEKWLPEVAIPFKEGERYYFTEKESEYIQSVYEDVVNISIDYGVMEKTNNAWVYEAPFGWSDMGTWEALFLNSERDDHNNFVHASETMIDKVQDSIIFTTKEDKLMVVKGMENYMVIDTPDVLMICPRDEQRFKNVLTDLVVKEKGKYQ